ncbi:hypothetical protein M885DRAFT_50409 [Pelagophyceae sp. CCMP2097]|nr:hypothetical protein M885DRAFT_50409 [Pelagophyceae sp. CCMP2097]
MGSLMLVLGPCAVQSPRRRWTSRPSREKTRRAKTGGLSVRQRPGSVGSRQSAPKIISRSHVARTQPSSSGGALKSWAATTWSTFSCKAHDGAAFHCGIKGNKGLELFEEASVSAYSEQADSRNLSKSQLPKSTLPNCRLSNTLVPKLESRLGGGGGGGRACKSSQLSRVTSSGST